MKVLNNKFLKNEYLNKFLFTSTHKQIFFSNIKLDSNIYNSHNNSSKKTTNTNKNPQNLMKIHSKNFSRSSNQWLDRQKNDTYVKKSQEVNIAF